MRLAILALIAIPSIASATKYAGEPYYIGVGARALALGAASVGARPDASSTFWNPASLTAIKNPEVMLQHAETFGTLLDHEYLGAAVPRGQISESWAFGAHLARLGGGGILLTEYDSTTGRPIVADRASHANWTVAISAARTLGQWGSVAVTAKSLINSLPGNSSWGLGLDLAWWKDWSVLRTGIKVADATSTFLSYDSGRNETIIPHVNWGGELDLPELIEGLRTTLAGEAETYFEGRETSAQYWQGSVSMDLHFGLEVSYQDHLYGRIGSDTGRLAMGAGFAIGRWALDGALTDHEFLDSSYRFSLRLLWP